MEFNLVTLLGISIVALFFGYFFGLFEGRGQGAKKRKSEEDGKVVVETPLPPLNPPSLPVDNRLLAVRLDEKDHPQLELDGRTVNGAQLTTEQRKRLIELMLILRPWVESNPGQKQTITPQPPPQPVTLPPSPPIIARQSPPAPVAPAPVPLPEPPAASSLAGQIDAILQARLIGTPLEDRGIRIVESTKGGALVFVGNKSYEAVGDVSDPEVQAAIRAAISEWEKRYTPGYK